MKEWLFNALKPLIIQFFISFIENALKQYQSPSMMNAPDAPGLDDDMQRLKEVLWEALDMAAQKQMNRAIENGAVSFSPPPGIRRD